MEQVAGSFQKPWLYSCFVEAEAFLKCVNLCCSKESYPPPSFRELCVCALVLLSLWASFPQRNELCLDLGCFNSGCRWKAATLKQRSLVSALTNHLTALQTHLRCATLRLPLTFKWLLPSEEGLGQPVYTDHSFSHLRTTGTDHWASMAAPTGTLLSTTARLAAD